MAGIESAFKRVPFGIADITLFNPETREPIMSFDGRSLFQAEGGELTLEPVLADITLADAGDQVVDKRSQGFTGAITIVAATETKEILEQAIASTTRIMQGEEFIGLTDAVMGTSIRDSGVGVLIHPRQYGEDTENDIYVYMMASDGEFVRAFANEQGNITMNLSMLPRNGMDFSKPGNYFYIGGVDPNADENDTP